MKGDRKVLDELNKSGSNPKLHKKNIYHERLGTESAAERVGEPPFRHSGFEDFNQS